MNATLQAQNAYRRSAQPIRTYRSTEYEAFVRVTGQLKSAAGKGRAGIADMAAAIHDNRQLWTILAADVAETGNALPDELRARILYLAEFTRVHSSRVLAAQASADPLIQINTAIMRGLRDDGDAA